MLAFEKFKGRNRHFWAYVRYISEKLGYSERGKNKLKRYSKNDVIKLIIESEFSHEDFLKSNKDGLTKLGKDVIEYLNKRNEIIEKHIAKNLMDRKQAKKEFTKAKKRIKPKCYLPFNKQKKEKRHHAFMTCLVNMLSEEALRGIHFEDNPKGLTLVSKNGKLLRVFSRWMDGAYPSRINPLAVWEIKEYYGTTTFGSRVADGVYETMLDGEELKELEEQEGIKIKHYLIIDDKFT